jgi:hypothetical protein
MGSSPFGIRDTSDDAVEMTKRRDRTRRGRGRRRRGRVRMSEVDEGDDKGL